MLAATFNGSHRTLHTRELLQASVTLPRITTKIIAVIHWEALQLWLKHLRLMPRQRAALTTTLSTAEGDEYTPPVLSTRAED